MYLHWTWLFVALMELQRDSAYHATPMAWKIAEYLSLFGIVLLHEFGHALVCRAVGGTAERILLWPLGGLAYVAPPPKPWAHFWSSAGGPLVNAVLLLLWPLCWGLQSAGVLEGGTDLTRFAFAVTRTNTVLFIFNVLPIYPLDGGQVLEALLWRPLGRARALLIVSIIGLIGSAAGLAYAVYVRSTWNGAIAIFLLQRSWQGLQSSRILKLRDSVPRHDQVACPSCKAAPFAIPGQRCGHCAKPFDAHATAGVCPHCGIQHEAIACRACEVVSPVAAWRAAGQVASTPVSSPAAPATPPATSPSSASAGAIGAAVDHPKP